jgi:putative inorganic carbon (hco3(-)) transporter
MRGLVFFLAFIACLPLIFMSPFNGVLIWYVFSLGNFHTLTWGFFSDLNYAYVIAVVTCFSWMISRVEKKRLPITPLVVMTLVFSVWMTITSFYALAPEADVWDKWTTVEKILFMCLVGFALTTTRERVNQLIWAVVLPVGFWGVKGTISVALHGGGSQIHGPDGGITAGNNEFGLALVMILPLLYYQRRLAVNRYIRRGLMVMGLLIMIAIVFTYSRGALVGICAMGAILWLRSNAKLAIGLAIVLLVGAGYALTPQSWQDRMGTIETYDNDSSAMSRIHLWRIARRIAELHPIMGAGFRATFWPGIINPMLEGTDIPKLERPRAVHSIYFDALSEHGWVGLALFVMIGGYSWFTCSWLIRKSRDRPDLAWANLLGRMGQPVLVGFWAAGTFASLAYFDQYWCILFIFDAARLVVAREIGSSASAIAIARPMRPLVPQPGVAIAALKK